MKIGTALEVREPLATLQPGAIYHLVWRDDVRALLVHLFERRQANTSRSKSKRPPTRPAAQLHFLEASAFESALRTQQLAPCAEQPTLPPWHQGIEGVDLLSLHLSRDSSSATPRLGGEPSATDRPKGRTLQDYINHREEVLADTWLHRREVFSMRDPDQEVKRRARTATPPQNEERFRVWFWVKCCFPATGLALLPTFHRVGSWSRGDQKYAQTKFGRKAADLGRHHTSPMNAPEDIQRILDAYRRHQALGKSLSRIYAHAMVASYGCVRQRDPKGRAIVVQPEGRPFPTYDQFRYRVYQALGKQRVAHDLLGAVRYRRSKAVSEGQYSQGCVYLSESVAYDAAFVEEIPCGLDRKTELQRLVVTEGVCKTSGMVVGIGFSLGSESQAGYQGARFCEAIGPRAYCRLFGIEVTEAEWPTVGLSAQPVTDRGPGSSLAARLGPTKTQPIRTMVPSYTPQSNGSVEAAHDRSVKIEGPPRRIVSRSTPYELIKHEILRVIERNQTGDMRNRLTPEMVHEGVLPNPLSIARFLLRRGRTLAQSIGFDDAVRQMLTPVQFNCSAGAAELYGHRFRSKALNAWLAEHQPRRLRGYVLELAVHYAWLDLDGRLVEVVNTPAIRTNRDLTYPSLLEMKEDVQLKRRLVTESRWEAHAHRVHSSWCALEETGSMIKDGRRLSGRAKPGCRSAVEGADEFRLIPRRGAR